jgi:hypothetical protein
MFKSRMPLLLLVAALLAGCGIVSLTGSGNVVTREEAITSFDRLDVSHGFEVEASQGDTFSVAIRVDDNVAKHLQVVKSGSTLKIGLKSPGSYNLKDATLEADVTMPELTRLDLRGGSHVNISGFRSSKALDGDLSGGSHLRGDVEAGDATFGLSGGSHVTLSGSAGDLKIDAGGGSHARLGDLAVGDADIKASSGSHATVNPSGRLDAVAKGGSHVRYLGSPTMGTIRPDRSSSVKQQ